MMKINFLVLIMVLCLWLAAEEEKTIVEHRLPGAYGGYEDIYPTGIIIEGFEDEDETEKFEHNVDFFFWLTEKLFGRDNIFVNMSMGITYSKLLEQQGIWENIVEYELYESYEAATLLGKPELNGVWKLDLRLMEKLYIQPELKYHYYSSDLEIEDFQILRADFPDADNHLDIGVKLHYISFPLIFRYEFVIDKKMKPFMTIGPSLNYFIAGSADWYYLSNLENGGEIFEEHGSIDLEKVEVFCWSISATFGFDWRHYFFKVGFESSLTDLNNVNREEYISDGDGKVKDFLINAYDYKDISVSMKVGFHFGK